MKTLTLKEYFAIPYRQRPKVYYNNQPVIGIYWDRDRKINPAPHFDKRFIIQLDGLVIGNKDENTFVYVPDSETNPTDPDTITDDSGTIPNDSIRGGEAA